MRLSHKIFVTTAVLILALAGVGTWSLLAINRLVDVNRAIATQSVPALRLSASLREQLSGLTRTEDNAGSPATEAAQKAWNDRASRMAKDLDLLRTFLGTEGERSQHQEALIAFTTYRRLAAMGPALTGERRFASERTGAHLDRILGATYGALEDAQVEARELEAHTWNTVFWALLLSLAAALTTAGFLTAHLTRSLRQLSVATGQLADGVFTEPLAVTSRDEIGGLARSFNRMADRLREVDRLKEELFSHISHELRTPLTSIKEATHLLLDGVPGPLTPRQSRLVSIIAISSNRLLGLVSQVLEFSRLRARVLPLERRPVDMEKLVVHALEELRPQVEERNLAVGRTTNGSDFGIRGDEDRLLRVVVNLLGNAVKFTPDGGAIVVGLTDRGGEVELTVRDSGIGIPQSEIARIFDPYQQAHHGRGGSGLGLAIVKGLVEAHGGQVSVESQEGEGSTFVLRLPRDGRPPGDSAPVVETMEATR
jgi:two-component system, NtrC family, sensor histidine kinase GlrK